MNFLLARLTTVELMNLICHGAMLSKIASVLVGTSRICEKWAIIVLKKKNR